MSEVNYSSILYYSIVFPNQYENIIKLVHQKVKGSFFVKKEGDGFDEYLGLCDDTNNQKENKEDKEEFFKTHQKNIQSLKSGEVFAVRENVFYKINDEFHITTLFTGGSKTPTISKETNENLSDIMEKHQGSELEVFFDKIAVSSDFIVIGIDKNNFNCPYYGNPVAHITVGLSKSGKKVFPKDSYTALEKGTVFKSDAKVLGLMSKCKK
jgi:hypothetical protein